MTNNAILIRALRGPLLLILIGSLFLLDHNTPFNFIKTWPVIIIFLGVMRLAERAITPPPPPVTPQGGAQ